MKSLKTSHVVKNGFDVIVLFSLKESVVNPASALPSICSYRGPSQALQSCFVMFD